VKIVILHTSTVSLDDLGQLFKRHLPGAEVRNIIDDSLLAEVSANGSVTPGIQARMNAYLMQAASLSPDLIFNQCSSVGEAFAQAARQTTLPTLRVDAAMADEAADLCPDGGRIIVAATVVSTLGPSVRLVADALAHLGKAAEVQPLLVEGALADLMRTGDRAAHDARVRAAVAQAILGGASVVVLAQGSMMRLEPQCADLGVPVLSSPERGVLRAVEMLRGQVKKG